MATFRLLDLVKFFLPILPEIESPIDRVSFDERVVFTIASAIIFLLAQFPVYGLKRDAFLELQDPLYSFRPIFAMEKGTLLELGLLPVVTSSLLWQLGAGLRLIKVNFNLRSDRELFQSGQKLTSFALAIVYTLGLIGAGYYNTAVKGFDVSVEALGFPPVGTLGLILLQVVGTSFIITLMVEVFDKGYGFGSGFLSFLALQAATNFVRDVISFESYSVGGPNELTQVYGALASVAVGLKDFTVNTDSFARTNLPNLIQVIISAAAILVVIGFQNLRIELPIRSTKVRGMANVFPIRLLYTGVLPIIFAYAVLTNLQLVGYITSSLLTKFTSSFVISSILGRWEVNAQSHHLELTGGLLYLLSPASSLLSTIISPIRSIVYSAVVVVLACWFGIIWANISGSAPRDIAKQFKEQGITIASKRDVSITKELSRVIPVASVSGAFVLAATAVITDLLGGLGKGVALVVGVSAAFGVLEEFTMEFQQSGGGSQFGSAFGAK